MQAITKVFSDIVKPYIDSENQTLTNEVDTIVNELGAKNILKNNAFSNNSWHGVSRIVNTDGTVTLNGTSNTWDFFNLNYVQGQKNIPSGTYIISGACENTSLKVIADGNTVIQQNGPGDAIFIITDAMTETYARVEIWSNKTYTSADSIIKPMIRPASITSDAFVPYAKNNQQLTKDDIGLTANAFTNGAVNLLENKASSATINGITFTVNSDGTVSAIGTAEADAALHYPVSIPNGKYKLSGCPSGGSSSTYRIQFQSSTRYYSEEGNGKEIDDNITHVYMSVYNGQTVNITFKPMITVADMPNSDYDHYVPYAMPNREITERLDYRSLGIQSYTATAANSWEYTGLSFTLDKPALVNVRGLNINSSVYAISVGTSPTVQSSAAYQFVDSSAARIQQTVFLTAGTYYVWAKFAGTNQNTISVNKLLEFSS